jgi:hypothetical protein
MVNSAGIRCAESSPVASALCRRGSATADIALPIRAQRSRKTIAGLTYVQLENSETGPMGPEMNQSTSVHDMSCVN